MSDIGFPARLACAPPCFCAEMGEIHGERVMTSQPEFIIEAKAIELFKLDHPDGVWRTDEPVAGFCASEETRERYRAKARVT